MNRIRARWWMDARWQDKLTGSSVSDVWQWRLDNDDQIHNLVKFVQRCQTSLTVVKRLYIWQEIAQLGRT